MSRSVRCAFGILAGFLVLLAATLTAFSQPDAPPRRPGRRQPTTTRPTPAATAPADPDAGRNWWVRFPPPLVKRIPIPDFPGAHAIWGGTGIDSRGHVWFGACAAGVESPSARLFEFVPATGQMIDRGDVVSALKRCGVYRPGEGQMKIHSKIVQLEDGHLYFASMDEQNEDLRARKLPTWGGHLWRLRLPENTWEHLLRTPEALMSVAGGGRHAYALGYYGHKLYQYDCRTGRTRSVKVGADSAHISRNFFTDRRGHVYVPRVVRRGGDEWPSATLVEFDADLKEITETPLAHYVRGSPMHSHGIVGFQPLNDGSIAFLTHQGSLYRLRPPRSGEAPARLKGVGWFHPRGSCYVPSLFTDPSNRYLMGVASRYDRFEWVIYSLRYGKSASVAFTLRGPTPLWHRRSLLYGSTARDKTGRTPRPGGEGHEPILMQVTTPW